MYSAQVGSLEWRAQCGCCLLPALPPLGRAVGGRCGALTADRFLQRYPADDFVLRWWAPELRASPSWSRGAIAVNGALRNGGPISGRSAQWA